jgi:hypothetical protein
MKDNVVETNLLKYCCDTIFSLMLAEIWKGLFSGVIFARFQGNSYQRRLVYATTYT